MGGVGRAATGVRGCDFCVKIYDCCLEGPVEALRGALGVLTPEVSRRGLVGAHRRLRTRLSL